MHTSTLTFRVTTLNLEQDHKRWDLRRELVIDQLAALQPDVMAFNEICIPLQTGADGAMVASVAYRFPCAVKTYGARYDNSHWVNHS